jgi:hypothetical protein
MNVIPARAGFTRALRFVALAVAALLLHPLPAEAGPSQKQYLVLISPDSVGAGQTVEYTFSATNQSGSQSLGSINLTAPAGFTLSSITQQPRRASDGAFVGTAVLNGSTLVEIRNLDLAPSDTVSLRFTAQAPCVQADGSGQWGLAAKQSNDFKGTGNDFTPSAESERSTSVTGACRLNWVTQPADAKIGQAITSTPYDAVDGTVGGPAIQAEVLSAPYADASRTRVTFSSAQVALQIGHDPNLPAAAANLSGTTTAQAVSGVATFTPGPAIGLHGLDYSLLAASSGISSGESGQFNVSDAAGDCTKGQCDNLKANGNTVNASVSSTSTTGVVALSIGVLDDLVCSGYLPNPTQQSVTIFPLNVSTGSTMTVEITVLASIVDRPASQYRVCWASTRTFTERDGTDAEAVTIAGEAMFQGLLPDCTQKNPVAPCQITPTKQNKQGNVILKVLAPGDDPHAR